MLNKRYRWKPNVPVAIKLQPGAMPFINEWAQRLKSGKVKMYDAVSPCGASPETEQSLLLSERDRYGFPLKTWISKRSGILWTSPIPDESGQAEFYNGFFQSIYRGPNDLISLRLAKQIERSERLLQFLWRASPDWQPRGKRVLDVGCGAGGMLLPFRELGASVFGCDIGGHPYIKFGRKMGLDVRMCNFEAMSSLGPFDLVMLSHVLEHIPDPIRFIDGLKPLLCHESIILIEVPGVLNLGAYNHDFLSYLQNSHTHHYSADTLSDLLSHAGMQTILVDETVRLCAKMGSDSSRCWSHKRFDVIISYLNKEERRFCLQSIKRQIKRVFYGIGLINK